MKKKSDFLFENFSFYGGQIFSTFEYACFRNVGSKLFPFKVEHDSKRMLKHYLGRSYLPRNCIPLMYMYERTFFI